MTISLNSLPGNSLISVSWRLFCWGFILLFHSEHFPLFSRFADSLCLFLFMMQNSYSPCLEGVDLYRKWALSFSLALSLNWAVSLIIFDQWGPERQFPQVTWAWPSGANCVSCTCSLVFIKSCIIYKKVQGCSPTMCMGAMSAGGMQQLDCCVWQFYAYRAGNWNGSPVLLCKQDWSMVGWGWEQWT